jgi:prophage DNA circulation protein
MDDSGARPYTPGGTPGRGVKGQLMAIENKLDDTCDQLRELAVKEETDKTSLKDMINALEDNLMSEINKLRGDMNDNFREVRETCDKLSKRLTVQKGENTSQAEQLKTTNSTVKRIDAELQALIKEVEGED